PRALCSRPSTPGCHYSFFTAPPTTEIYTLSLHDALPISMKKLVLIAVMAAGTLVFQSCSSDDNGGGGTNPADTMVPTRLDYGSRSEEHTSELQSRENLVCRLLLEKKNEDTAGEKPPPRRR